VARPKKARPVSVKIYLGADDLWHGYLTVGTRPNGRPDRRHRSGRTREECEQKIRELEDSLAADDVPEAGRPQGVEQWLRHWCENIARPHVSYNTYTKTYAYSVYRYLIPGVGAHRIDRLEADHLEALYQRLLGTEEKRGLSPGTVALIHRTAHAALEEAVRRGKVKTNVAKVARTVEPDPADVVPFTVDEARRILAVTARRRNAPRWSLAMVGLRQGEALGPCWPDLDWDTGILTIRGQVGRRKWQHGCDDPVRCARWRHGCGRRERCAPSADRCPRREVRCRLKPCRPAWEHGCPDRGRCTAKQGRACRRRRKAHCPRHRGECPPPCAERCDRHAASCPKRKGGGIVMDEGDDRATRTSRRRLRTKSKAGDRRVALPAEIVAELREHRQVQLAERMRAGSMWQDNDLIFCSPTGAPLDASRDRLEWKSILTEAGVRDARGHDARHSAATMLLLKGVDRRVVMDIMGWSSERMLSRYQHVVDEMRTEAAKRLGSVLFGAGSATDHATRDDLALGKPSTRRTKVQVKRAV
jgi:integrase